MVDCAAGDELQDRDCESNEWMTFAVSHGWLSKRSQSEGDPSGKGGARVASSIGERHKRPVLRPIDM